MAKKTEFNEMPIEEEKVVENVVEEPKVDAIDQYIFTQLKIINGMSNQAKAKRLAERVLRNKRKG